jgi:replicative DNA helicase
MLDEAESKIFAIAEQGARGAAGLGPMQPLLTQVVERIDELYSRDNQSPKSRACRPASSTSTA